MAEKIRKPSFTRFKIKNDGDGHFIVSFDGTAQEEVILSTGDKLLQEQGG